MTTLLNAVANGVGATEVLVYEVPSGKNSMLLGALITNVYGAIMPATVKVRKGAADTHLAKDRRIDPGKSIELVESKVVLMAGDQVYAQAADDQALDVLLSIAEGV